MNAPRLLPGFGSAVLFVLCVALVGDGVMVYGDPNCPNCARNQMLAQGPANQFQFPGTQEPPPLNGPAPMQPQTPFTHPPHVQPVPQSPGTPQFPSIQTPQGNQPYAGPQFPSSNIPYPEVVGPADGHAPAGVPVQGQVAHGIDVDDANDPPIPMVKLRVKAPACSPMGKEIEYRVKVENCSQADAHHVIVKSALPVNVKLISASPIPHQKEPELQWHLGTLPAGGCHDIIVVLSPVGSWDVKNCFRVQFEYGQCVTTKLVGNPLPEGAKGLPPEITPGGKTPNTSPEPPFGKGPRLWIQINGPKQQYTNLAATYRIAVANKGNALAKNVLITAHLPKEAAFVAATENGRHLLDQVAWFVDEIQPNQIKTVEVSIKTKVAGAICIKATALGDENLRVEDEVCTAFQGVSALLMESVDRDDPIELGSGTSYPILLRNTGSAPVTNIQVRAFIPPELSLVRAAGPVDHQPQQATAKGQWILFKPLAFLEPDAKTAYEVFVKGERAGDARFHVEVLADQLDNNRPVIEEESTLVVNADELPKIRPLSRRKKTVEETTAAD
ncbi:MAG: DUF11 domain-containing protein [Gemmataceae bacterium]|nr:DUF11 domain-containing protein [Gemmataceae bacterium]